MLRLLSLGRSQEIYWWRYGSTDVAFYGYVFKMVHLFDVPPLRAKKRSKACSSAIVQVPGHEFR